MLFNSYKKLLTILFDHSATNRFDIREVAFWSQLRMFLFQELSTLLWFEAGQFSFVFLFFCFILYYFFFNFVCMYVSDFYNKIIFLFFWRSDWKTKLSEFDHLLPMCRFLLLFVFYCFFHLLCHWCNNEEIITIIIIINLGTL